MYSFFKKSTRYWFWVNFLIIIIIIILYINLINLIKIKLKKNIKRWKKINCNKNMMIHNIIIYNIYNNTNYCVCSCGNFDFIDNS